MSSSACDRQYKCIECGRGYLRSSHLQRHQATHSTAQRKTCPFCHRQFLRSDVLLRHSRACRLRDTRAVPQGQRRGRKRTSCDQCSQTHTMCDGDCPCEACLAASLGCSYNSLRQSSPAPAMPIQHDSTQPGMSLWQSGEESTIPPDKISIPFILNYTDQSSKSSFDLHCMLGGESSSFAENPSPATADPFPELWSSLFHAFINPSAMESQCHDSTQFYGLDDSDGLTETTARLISHLERCNIGNPEHQQVDISAARFFFCAARLSEYVHSFFDHSSHTNCIIHRPSFNINTTSTHLLLVISLLGAVCRSPEEAMEARFFSDLVRHSLFEGPEFQHILYSKNPPLSEDNIQLVQAAMLMMVLQAAREEFDINRRIRTQCFPALVSVIRSLGLTQMINDANNYGQPASLDDYIRQETLVRIMSWAYLLDGYSVVFYRSPPQFKIVEANFGLPRNDPLFDAMDPSDCDGTILDIDAFHSPVSLKLVVQQLMGDEPIQPNEIRRHINTLFALSLVLSALHCILFDIQALEGCIDATSALIPVERALDRWRELYDMFQSELQASKPSKPGFMIHSLEFWWLAKQFVRRPDTALNNERFAADSIKSFHAMVQELKGPNESI